MVQALENLKELQQKRLLKIVVVIPAYNEEKTIANVITGVRREMMDENLIEVMVIDDGSDDSTVSQARRAGADVIVTHKSNKGVGAAFATGVSSALKRGADIIVTMDADGQFSPRDIPRLIGPILRTEADFVTGSRFSNANSIHRMPRIKLIGNKLFTRLVSSLTGCRFTDTQCGFRAYSQRAAMRLNTFGEFTYTQEVFIDLLSKGMTVKEIPIKVGDRKGKSKVVTHWYSYGLQALAIIIRTFRDYMPLKFFGLISLAMIVPGVGLGGFLTLHWMVTGRTSPYTSLLYLVVILLTMGIIFLVLALIADMIGRLRRIEEELLYRSKLHDYNDMDSPA
ncbi:MAG: glycosyltransferase family 2 protein [Dehalococcoidales bacterium]|nr:glycosyltransferase family 2 protein [Dehalococcoidales bacterium]